MTTIEAQGDGEHGCGRRQCDLPLPVDQQYRWRRHLVGLEETFTINRLGLSPKLRRCLATTNLIESPHSGVRLRTRRVTNWQGGGMVLRWAAGAFLATEANFRRVDGYRDLWMLKAALDEQAAEGK